MNKPDKNLTSLAALGIAALLSLSSLQAQTPDASAPTTTPYENTTATTESSPSTSTATSTGQTTQTSAVLPTATPNEVQTDREEHHHHYGWIGLLGLLGLAGLAGRRRERDVIVNRPTDRPDTRI